MKVADEFVNVDEWLVLAGRLRGFETPLGAVVDASHFEDHDCAVLWEHLSALAPGDSVMDVYNDAGRYGREPLTSRAAVLLHRLSEFDVTFDRFADAAWELVREDEVRERAFEGVTEGKGPVTLGELELLRYARNVRGCGVRRRAPQRLDRGS